MQAGKIVDYAMECGAIWAGVEPVALLRPGKMGVHISFPSDHEAVEFCYYVRDWLHDEDITVVDISREQEFVLIRLN
jgi:hypothetical protein